MNDQITCAPARLKSAAKAVKTHLAEKHSVKIKHGQSLDLAAIAYGYRDFRHFNALNEAPVEVANDSEPNRGLSKTAMADFISNWLPECEVMMLDVDDPIYPLMDEETVEDFLVTHTDNEIYDIVHSGLHAELSVVFTHYNESTNQTDVLLSIGEIPTGGVQAAKLSFSGFDALAGLGEFKSILELTAPLLCGVDYDCPESLAYSEPGDWIRWINSEEARSNSLCELEKLLENSVEEISVFEVSVLQAVENAINPRGMPESFSWSECYGDISLLVKSIDEAVKETGRFQDEGDLLCREALLKLDLDDERISSILDDAPNYLSHMFITDDQVLMFIDDSITEYQIEI